MSAGSSKRIKSVELEPDGWSRFEQAVDAAVKSGPMHRKTKPKRESAKSPPKRGAVKKSVRSG
jgi:hypothetical protein